MSKQFAVLLAAGLLWSCGEDSPVPSGPTYVTSGPDAGSHSAGADAGRWVCNDGSAMTGYINGCRADNTGLPTSLASAWCSCLWECYATKYPCHAEVSAGDRFDCCWGCASALNMTCGSP